MKQTFVTTFFAYMLTTLFIGLKLMDEIQWSWLWVLSPLWIPLAVGLSVVIIGVAIIKVLK